MEPILKKRIYPLLYFWGTCPQTCLFGYLYGQDAEPKPNDSGYTRQYLEVSDIQYLMSNVDLSSHYELAPNLKEKLNASTINPNKSKSRLKLKFKIKKSLTKKLSRTSKNSSQLPITNNHAVEQAISQIQQANLQMRPRLMVSRAEESLFCSHQLMSEQLSLSDDIGEKNCNKEKSNSSSSISSSAVSSNSSTLSSNKQTNKRHPLKNSASLDSGVLTSPSLSSSSVLSLDVDEISSGSSSGCETDTIFAKSRLELAGLRRQANESNMRQESQCCYTPNCGQTPPVPKSSNFGLCAVDWHKDSHKNYHANGMVALVAAGLTTGNDRRYVAETVENLTNLGFEVCVFIRRGVGGLPLISAKFFSLSKWRDIDTAISTIKSQRPNSKLVAVGFSFGSVELCRYLSMRGKQSLVDAAILISCPYDPGEGSKCLSKSALHRMIDSYLAKNLGLLLYNSLFGEQDDNATKAEDMNLGDVTKVATQWDVDSPHHHKLNQFEANKKVKGVNIFSENKSYQNKIEDEREEDDGEQEEDNNVKDRRKKKTKTKKTEKKNKAKIETRNGKLLELSHRNDRCIDLERNEYTTNDKELNYKQHDKRQNTDKLCLKQQQQQVKQIGCELSASKLMELTKLKSLKQFEHSINSVVQNYPSPAAYEEDSCLVGLLENINTPTLCLSSEDDPFAPLKLLPIKEIEANEKMCMLLTKIGGHMAFVDGLFWPKKPYFGQRIIERFLKTMITEWSKIDCETVCITTTKCNVNINMSSRIEFKNRQQ